MMAKPVSFTLFPFIFAVLPRVITASATGVYRALTDGVQVNILNYKAHGTITGVLSSCKFMGRTGIILLYSRFIQETNAASTYASQDQP